ncbi:hypothetical protein EVAR_33127_1 [Eumeta japonica]|uniref:Uncharacterized protein n=1 Tax=Eumeta variegata TaxID=151549 RepID=A0A4C1Y9U6_EUMVA|nr:hypothetical protein EVAR_33127_1 [Eumeta japonica]
MPYDTRSKLLANATDQSRFTGPRFDTVQHLVRRNATRAQGCRIVNFGEALYTFQNKMIYPVNEINNNDVSPPFAILSYHTLPCCKNEAIKRSAHFPAFDFNHQEIKKLNIKKKSGQSLRLFNADRNQRQYKNTSLSGY